MKEIPLTQGKTTRIDDEDFDAVIEAGSQHPWHAHKSENTFYAARTVPDPDNPGKQSTQFLHRFLRPGAAQVDHKDGDGLNNQSENLREATDTQNQANQKKQSRPTSSVFKGVSLNINTKSWMARIRVKGILLHLGYYESEEDAAHVYDYAARIYFGEFARPNFP